MLTQEEYSAYCREFRSVERYLRSKSADIDTVVYNICSLRGYYVERMAKVLKEAGFMFIEDKSVFENLSDCSADLGLFKDGRFLLEGRFIFPVQDMLGNTVAMIGWFPDEKRYITTPSRLFSKSCMFYGMEQLGMTGIGAKYFLCEGIFDALSVRSVGFNAIAMMGITSGRVKEVLYSLFSKVVGVPDNDSQGRDVLRGDKWSLPWGCSYFRWVGDNSKDIDELINSYERDDIVEMLSGVMENGERVVEVRV